MKPRKDAKEREKWEAFQTLEKVEPQIERIDADVPNIGNFSSRNSSKSYKDWKLPTNNPARQSRNQRNFTKSLPTKSFSTADQKKALHDFVTNDFVKMSHA